MIGKFSDNYQLSSDGSGVIFFDPCRVRQFFAIWIGSAKPLVLKIFLKKAYFLNVIVLSGQKIFWSRRVGPLFTVSWKYAYVVSDLRTISLAFWSFDLLWYNFSETMCDESAHQVYTPIILEALYGIDLYKKTIFMNLVGLRVL